MDGIIIRDLDVFMIQQYQQNRYPCLFIDYVCELVPGKFAKGQEFFLLMNGFSLVISLTSRMSRVLFK